MYPTKILNMIIFITLFVSFQRQFIVKLLKNDGKVCLMCWAIRTIFAHRRSFHVGKYFCLLRFFFFLIIITRCACVRAFQKWMPVSNSRCYKRNCCDVKERRKKHQVKMGTILVGTKITFRWCDREWIVGTKFDEIKITRSNNTYRMYKRKCKDCQVFGKRKVWEKFDWMRFFRNFFMFATFKQD